LTDLYIAIVVTITISALLCAGALLLAKHLSRPVATTIVVLLTVFLFWHALYFLDDLRIARVLPYSSVMVLGNFWPEAAGLFVGFGWRLVPGGRLRKALMLMPMVGVALFKTYAPALTHDIPTLGDRWDHGVCRQTSKESCSAAAAATLLSLHGIVATEQEMAQLCRTTHHGTTMLGLYRGLKLKTAGTRWDVEVFHGSVQQLRGLGGPFLVSVGLKRGQTDVDPRYGREWGWPVGLKHTVVIVDYPGPEVEIADPAVGHEHWSSKDLETLFYDEGLRLIKRR
jgi:hypothetical protein